MSSMISRRRLLAGGGALAVGGAFHAVVIEPHWLEVTEHEVAVPELPRSLDGFTIAQVTDAHLRRIGRVEEAISRALQAHDVRLLVLTGDIIDSSEGLDTLREFCGGVRRQGMASAVPFVPNGSGRFVAGWYDLAGCAAYVSRGTGTSIVPARFTCRPELPIFRLRQG